jgi:ankyrin repeat protein
VDARGGSFVIPLFAALVGRHFQTAEPLRHNGADVNACNGATPLHAAARRGDFEMVQLLVKYRVDVDS